MHVSRKEAVKFKLGYVFLCVIALVMAYVFPLDDANARDANTSSVNPMTTEEIRANGEAAIRELIDGFVKAIRARDIDRVMSVFAPEVISFDLGPPLQHGGGEAFKRRWQELFESFRGPIDYEVRDLAITAGNDVAFSHSLNRISGTMKNGRKTDRWLRWTACY